MAGTVLLLSLVWERLWVSLPASVYFASWQQTGISMGLILIGAIIAFLLVREAPGHGEEGVAGECVRWQPSPHTGKIPSVVSRHPKFG
jgi:hypothetical protein